MNVGHDLKDYSVVMTEQLQNMPSWVVFRCAFDVFVYRVAALKIFTHGYMLLHWLVVWIGNAAVYSFLKLRCVLVVCQ